MSKIWKKPDPVHIAETDPIYMQYWNQRFKSRGFWFDWQIFVQNCEHHIPRIMSEEGMKATAAREAVWISAGEAHEKDGGSFLFDEYTDFVSILPPEDLPYFLCHFDIGISMMWGATEEEARESYVEWLHEDILNAIWGHFAITDDLKVVDLATYLESIEYNPDRSRKIPGRKRSSSGS